MRYYLNTKMAKYWGENLSLRKWKSHTDRENCKMRRFIIFVLHHAWLRVVKSRLVSFTEHSNCRIKEWWPFYNTGKGSSIWLMWIWLFSTPWKMGWFVWLPLVEWTLLLCLLLSVGRDLATAQSNALGVVEICIYRYTKFRKPGKGGGRQIRSVAP
jgi:hypothetical protein